MMSDKKIRNFSDLFSRKQSGKRSLLSPSPGLYHYDFQQNGERSRVHLRIDEDANGIILINANRLVHLNPSATYMSWLILEGEKKENAIRMITRRYQVSYNQASNDYTQIETQIRELIRPEGACPIHHLDLEIIAPFSTRPSSPYRMDLALTYRCNNDCAHCYNARSRNFPESSLSQWKTILDHLWDIGIPHVVFTGGEPTLFDALPELISHAEKNGQITGLNTNGRRISDASFLNTLVSAGLDHIQITVESHSPEIHDQMVQNHGSWKQTITGLENALNSPLYVMTNTTLLRENSPYLEETLHFLASKGVPTIGLNALIYAGHGINVGTGIKEEELPGLLALARDITENNQQKLIWYTPTEYCNFDPMQLELGVKGCTAALYNMCIEPDGSVLPCQSYYITVGNILNDPWQSIWNHPLCLSLRERKNTPSKCNQCGLLPECGGGCPLKNLESKDTGYQ